MNRLSSLKSQLLSCAGFAPVVAALYAASAVLVAGADPQSEKGAKPDQKAEQKTEKKAGTKSEKKKLSGSELYSIHCGRCHAERYPTEFTAAQWKTIGTEMRVRANLPAADAKAIIKYLQEDSGTP
jgi:mono/diheme cytochrome c family protein